MKILYFIITFFFLFTANNGFAQGDGFLEIEGKFSVYDGKPESLIIEVYEGQQRIERFDLGSARKYKLAFDFGVVYQVKFLHDGMVTQLVDVDTRLSADIQDNTDFPAFSFDIELFPRKNGVDYSALDHPIVFIQYNATIDNFDANYKAYEELVEKYTKKVDELVSAEPEPAMDKRKAYDEAIKQADILFKQEDLKEAKKFYQQALYFLPAEAYPKKQIVAIDQLFIQQHKLAQEQAKREEEYQDLIDEADKLYKRDRFDEARSLYAKAKELKPNDEYVLYKLEDIQAVKELKQKDDDYLRLVNEGDKYFEQKQYSEAKTAFSGANQLKPDEKYPPRKLAEIEDLLKREEQLQKHQAKIDKAYNDYLQAADQQFQDGKFEEARPNYLSASNIKPEEAYPRKQLAAIDDLLNNASKEAALARINKERYQALITSADAFFSNEHYREAQKDYEEAAGLFPEEVYPPSQIAKIKQLLEEQAAAESVNQEKEAAYLSALKQADNQFAQQAYLLARKSYQAALEIKPGESYPTERIAAIDQLLENEQEAAKQAQLLEENYRKLISQADQEFQAKSWKMAQSTYQSALSLKPNEPYPTSQLDKIETFLSEQLAMQELSRQYQELVGLADAKFSVKDYPIAKQYYEDALKIKPEKPYPAERIKEIDRLLLQQQDALAAREATEKEFERVLTEAIAQKKQEEWDAAIRLFKQAQELLPQRPEPPKHLAEIEQFLSNREKAIDQEYQGWITLADQDFDATRYSEAKINYQKALEIKPDKVYPKERIQQIEDLLRSLAEEKENARLREEQYAQAIAEADIKYREKGYAEALTLYRKASAIKPNENYPKEQIAAIESLLAKQQAAENELKRIDAAYASAVAKGDDFFSRDLYSEAITAYQEALSYKPKERYPLQQIEKLEELLARQAAANAEQLRLKNRFDDLVFGGDQAFEIRDYELSKRKFKEALSIFPDEPYPAQRLKDIEAAIAHDREMAANRELDEAYRVSLLKADKSYEKEALADALHHYRTASELKPAEAYPKEMIQKILDFQQKERELKLATNEANSRYEELIYWADSLFNTARYYESRSHYEQASTILPEEVYPKERMKEIDWLLREKDIASRAPDDANDPYFEAIQKADEAFYEGEFSVARFYYRKALAERPLESYPADQLELIDSRWKNRHLAKLEQDYRQSIQLGDERFREAEYPASRFYFRKALGIKPEAKYPKVRLSDIEDALRLRKMDERFAEYERLMVRAEAAILEQEYAVAEFYLDKASRVKGNQVDPQERLSEIESIKEGLKQDELNHQFKLALEKADEHYLHEDFNSARFFYKKALEYKPSDSYTRQQLEEIQRYFNPDVGSSR